LASSAAPWTAVPGAAAPYHAFMTIPDGEPRADAAPYATGGGGTVLEHRYGAVLLTCLLTGDPVSELGDDATPVSVRFQASAISPVDDLLVTGNTPDGGERTVSIGVRRVPALAASDEASARLLASYVQIVTGRWEELRAGRWRLCLAVVSPNAAVRQLAALTEIARASVNEAQFRAEVARPGRTNQSVRARLPHVDGLVAAARAGMGLADVEAGELTWRLLSSLRTRELRLEGADQVDRTRAVSVLRAVTPDGSNAAADQLFSRLAELANGYAPAGAQVTKDQLLRDLAGMPLRPLPEPSRAQRNAAATARQPREMMSASRARKRVQAKSGKPAGPRLVDRLSGQIPIKRMLIGFAIGSLSIVVAIIAYYFTRSSTATTPLPTSSQRAQNPVPLFHGKFSTHVHRTKLVLYSLSAVIYNAGKQVRGKGVVSVIGNPLDPSSYCAGSRVLGRVGAYRCIISTAGLHTIADPCFGVDKAQVECQLPSGAIGLVGTSSPIRPRQYHASLAEIGRQYPWHLELANGLNCAWNWSNFREHHGGGWICARTGAPIEFHPEGSSGELTGRNALNYNQASITGKKYIYYAEALVQGTRLTWSVLLENPGNPDVFMRVPVAQAWY
jgi:hypothetical protein